MSSVERGRLSFQQFVGLGYDQEIPDFTTVWHFKEGLVRAGLMDSIFVSIVEQIERKGLILKKGTIVDATIIRSANRPLSNQKREKLEQRPSRVRRDQPSRQIDTEAASTAKGGKRYFGYKGHIGIDAESKIIRKRAFTPANIHDIREMESVLSGDEKSVFAVHGPTPPERINSRCGKLAYTAAFWIEEHGAKSCRTSS